MWTTSAIENPFESPASAPQPVADVYPVARTAFAAINFTVAVLFAISAVISFVAPESPEQFLGGILFATPIAGYAFCEWLVLYRRRASTERKLGFANCVCGALAVFVVLVNLDPGEARSRDAPADWQSLIWIVLIGGTIALYLVASGWCRLRWTRSK